MPHYLGGKLGRSSSRSIFLSIHLTPQALPRAAATSRPRHPPLPPVLELLVSSTSRVKKEMIVLSALQLSLSFSFTHTPVSVPVSLHSLLWDRISFHPRSSSVTSFLWTDRRLQPLSPSLSPRPPPSPPESTAAPPQFSVSSEQRERVTIYSGDLRDRGSSALSSHAASLASSPPPSVLHRSAVSPAPRSAQSGSSPYPAVLLPPFLLVLIPYSCVIYAGSG